MGIFKRPDSPYWWLYFETTKRKERTNILVHGRAEKREAQVRYFARMLEYAEEDTNVLLARAIGLLVRRRGLDDGRDLRIDGVDEISGGDSQGLEVIPERT